MLGPRSESTGCPRPGAGAGADILVLAPGPVSRPGAGTEKAVEKSTALATPFLSLPFEVGLRRQGLPITPQGQSKLCEDGLQLPWADAALRDLGLGASHSAFEPHEVFGFSGQESWNYLIMRHN